MFEDVGMMWLVLAGKEKSAGVPLVFEPRAEKGTPPAVERQVFAWTCFMQPSIEKKKVTLL